MHLFLFAYRQRQDPKRLVWLIQKDTHLWRASIILSIHNCICKVPHTFWWFSDLSNLTGLWHTVSTALRRFKENLTPGSQTVEMMGVKRSATRSVFYTLCTNTQEQQFLHENISKKQTAGFRAAAKRNSEKSNVLQEVKLWRHTVTKQKLQCTI